MIKRSLLVVLSFASSFFVSIPYARAQGPCATPSDQLICVFPQLYSQAGGVDLPNAAHHAHFDNDFEQNASALNAAVGTELTALRLASPASGLVFVFDKSLGVVRPSTESYGPILGERAETIGRHRFFVALTYQYFPFSSLDGIDLKRVPAVYKHADTLNPDGSPRTAGQPASLGNPGPELEYIATTSRIDLKVHQATFYATYGLTSRLDVSVALPILDVHMGVTSSARIVRDQDNIAQPVTAQQYADFLTGTGSPSDQLAGRLYPSTGPDANCANPAAPLTSTCQGYFHYFDRNDPAGSLNATFSKSSAASGIGDVLFRVKGTLLKRERAAAAIGADIRVPTGDEKNFLGSGAAGFKPFVAVSYRARVSPHVNLGYEFNGSSILAGDASTGQKSRLPDQFFYSVGADVGITKKLTGAVDLLGQRFYGAPGVVKGPFVDWTGASHQEVAQVTPTRHSFNMNDFAVGGKYEIAGNLLFTGNLQIKLDDGGLRAKVVPLVGLSYTF